MYKVDHAYFHSSTSINEQHQKSMLQPETIRVKEF